jgi:hypothetical protein
MATAVPFIIAATTVASAAVGYMSSRQQAKALEANAKAVEEQGKYNAAIERSNAQAQQQQSEYDRAVVLANRQRAMDEAEREQAIFAKKTQQELAGFDAKFGYGGTFNSFMDSLEDDAYAQQISVAAQISDESLSGYLQANEHTRMGKLYHQRGETNARNILFGAQNESNNLKNQASATKTAGIASALGTIAGGVSGTSSALSSNQAAGIKSFGFGG